MTVTIESEPTGKQAFTLWPVSDSSSSAHRHPPTGRSSVSATQPQTSRNDRRATPAITGHTTGGALHSRLGRAAAWASIPFLEAVIACALREIRVSPLRPSALPQWTTGSCTRCRLGRARSRRRLRARDRASLATGAVSARELIGRVGL